MKNKGLLPIVATVLVIISVAFWCNKNTEFLKQFSNNMTYVKAILKIESRINLTIDENITVYESNFVPYNNYSQKQQAIDSGITISNQTSQVFDIDYALENPLDIGIEIDSSDPQILLINTHGTESYTKTENQDYIESSERRTLDQEYNVNKISDVLCEILNNNGINTIMSDEYHDYPEFSGAYTRSLVTIEQYIEEYPSIKMVIDVHRDAILYDDGRHKPTESYINGESSAQLMFVIGTNEGGLDHPNWSDNLNVALNLQESLISTGLMRSLNLRTSRFNQHATPASMILEVGSSGNTLEQAIVAIKVFGVHLSEYIKTQQN